MHFICVALTLGLFSTVDKYLFSPNRMQHSHQSICCEKVKVIVTAFIIAIVTVATPGTTAAAPPHAAP